MLRHLPEQVKGFCGRRSFSATTGASVVAAVENCLFLIKRSYARRGGPSCARQQTGSGSSAGGFDSAKLRPRAIPVALGQGVQRVSSAAQASTVARTAGDAQLRRRLTARSLASRQVAWQPRRAASVAAGSGAGERSVARRTRAPPGNSPGSRSPATEPPDLQERRAQLSVACSPPGATASAPDGFVRVDLRHGLLGSCATARL